MWIVVLLRKVSWWSLQKPNKDHLVNYQTNWKVIFFTIHQHRGLMVWSLLFLTMLLALPKIHWCHCMRQGELVSMDPVKEFLVKIQRFQDVFLWVNIAYSVLQDNQTFDMLFVNSFKASFTFPSQIRNLNYLDILAVFVALSGAYKRACIVWPSYNSP